MTSLLLLVHLNLIGALGGMPSHLPAAGNTAFQDKDNENESITLVIRWTTDQGKTSKKKTIKDIPFQKKMTVLDVMKYAAGKKKIKFSHRGKNETAFLTEIDGIKNQGARGDNWIFRVNDMLGKKSFGVTEIQPGDSVSWTFGKYKP